MTTSKPFDQDKQKVTWIPCKNISVVWAGAQRPYREDWAKEIADNFDPDRFDPIVVTMPNGNGIYHLVEGQHRKSAVEILGGAHQQVPCRILPEADEARAAKLFKEINTGRRRPTPIELFKVSVTAGDEAEVEVNKIIRAAGYRVDSAPGEKNIAAVAATVAVYKQFGGDILKDSLKLLQATWGMDNNAVSAQMIRGYAAFMAEHGRYANWGRLKEVIAKKYTPGRFIGAAKSARELTGGNMADAVKGLLLSNYNRALPEGKKLKSKKG